MYQIVPDDAHAPRDMPMDGRMRDYIAALVDQAAGTIVFRTGAGRMLEDLLLHWPLMEQRESEAQELCARIIDAVYPLTGELHAQGVEISVTISPAPVEAPEQVRAFSTCVIFDIVKKIERVIFLSPEQGLPDTGILRMEKGVVAMCSPLQYMYHTLSDDRAHTDRPHIGIFELPKRMIDELYEQPDFVPHEKAVLEMLRTIIHEMPKRIELGEAERRATEAAAKPPQTAVRPPPVIPPFLSLIGLPSAVLHLERLLLSYIMDPAMSLELRFRLRYISQIVRALYPRALIEEAAQAETGRAAFTPAKAPAPDAAQARRDLPQILPYRAPAPERGD